MEAVDINPEMEEFSVLGSQDILLLQSDSESKLKFDYFILFDIQRTMHRDIFL
jgi:hypothetical protein